MPGMNRVLIATDGSELAVEAARRAGRLLADFEATVLGVVPPPIVPPGAAVTGIEGVALPVADPETVAEIDESLTVETKSGVERTIAALGRPAKALIVHGDPAGEICRIAEEGAYDLVVIGSHGSGFVKRVLLGSVSHYVMQHAPCPVLVVRAPRAD
jgi:nucleotide-binding universal stress UspA family protein